MPQYPNQPKLKKVSHGAHLILSIITGGLWLPIWIYVTLKASQHNKQVMFEHQMAVMQAQQAPPPPPPMNTLPPPPPPPMNTLPPPPQPPSA